MMDIVSRQPAPEVTRAQGRQEMVQIRIKQWFLNKNALDRHGACGVTSAYWWQVTEETEKAYHVSEMELYCWRGGWVPKSCVLEVREEEGHPAKEEKLVLVRFIEGGKEKYIREENVG